MSRVNSSVERAVEITESDHRPTLTIEDACAIATSVGFISWLQTLLSLRAVCLNVCVPQLYTILATI